MQLSAAYLSKYVCPFSGHKALKGQNLQAHLDSRFCMVSKLNFTRFTLKNCVISNFHLAEVEAIELVNPLRIFKLSNKCCWWQDDSTNIAFVFLIHFSQMFPFHTSWKRQKTKGSLSLSSTFLQWTGHCYNSP